MDRDGAILRWIGAGLTVAGALSLVGGVFWFLLDSTARDEQWLELDKSWNEESLGRLQSILHRQSDIQKELATQTLRLAEIEGLINRHWTERRDGFEELESEHKDVMIELGRLGYSFGVHEGAHHQRAVR